MSDGVKQTRGVKVSFDLDVYTARCLKQQSYFIDDWKNMCFFVFFAKGVVHCLIFTKSVLCVLKQLDLNLESFRATLHILVFFLMQASTREQTI